jgi:hypothetical protein
MTPKEKAKELVDKMWIYALPNANGSWVNAKQCALIAVDLILNQYNTGMFDFKILSDEEVEYWQEVKQEIKKL